MAEPSIEYYNAALDAIEAGNLPEARTAVENSLTENPADAETWQLYVIVLNSLGLPAEAAKATEKLRELGLDPIDEMLLKAAELETSGDIAGAVSLYGKALDEDPTRAGLRTGYALALMKSGDPSAALSAAKDGVASEPYDARTHYALGHILRLTGDKTEALKELTEAVTIEPDFMIAVYEQGMLLAESGKTREALANFEKFLAAHPTDPSATQAVAQLRETLGQ